jgi:hypothetical protein
LKGQLLLLLTSRLSCLAAVNVLQNVKTDVVVKPEDAFNTNDPRFFRQSRDGIECEAFPKKL